MYACQTLGTIGQGAGSGKRPAASDAIAPSSWRQVAHAVANASMLGSCSSCFSSSTNRLAIAAAAVGGLMVLTMTPPRFTF